MMHRMLPFFAFMHLHLASHLGTLDVPRVDVKHGMLESNQKTVLVDGSRRWKDPESTCLNRRCMPSECHLTSTNLVLDPRQAPEHSKSLIFYKILLESFMFDALGDKS